ncbi:OLC1v1010438C1 [Oldenlandia corymbosa var. corymbosa]|uniref:OLC1v1010438C1 n=1 Tax=Oldenlandia corymbosa var. corymbosa TaxID=529605 RepID=A0AAV1DRJ6_OLDCO|nr:OLC1v1010438C1 [Oldenlandia corymbosa var. corymbosa]
MSHMRYNRVGSSKRYSYSSTSSSSSSSSSSSTSTSCHGFRGFRLNPKRFSVQRLRTKFLFLMKLFSKWRNSYGNALRSLRKNISSSRGSKSFRKDQSGLNTSSRRNLVFLKNDVDDHRNSTDRDCRRMKSFARTNSFYTEAIADCLDFIKRNSLSLDENPVLHER